MKRKLLIGLGIMLSANLMIAQTTEAEDALKARSDNKEEGWKKGGVFSLNFTQTSLTNWSAGGESSLALNGLLSAFANYSKGKSTWDNSLDLGYGFLKSGDADLIKTDDKIDFMSKYGQEAFKNWYYAGLINFRTQMAPGYNYPNDSIKISDLLAPAYILGAIGLDYKPNESFTLFIAPITSKTTIVNDETLSNAGAFGVDPGKTIRNEFGGYLRAIYVKDLMENINLNTKLELFSNYLENPQNIDVNWEVLLAMKVNKYISATLSTQLLYDHDIDIAVDTDGDDIPDGSGPRTQFKEVLGIGFTYKF